MDETPLETILIHEVIAKILTIIILISIQFAFHTSGFRIYNVLNASVWVGGGWRERERERGGQR